jgi:catechol 2,3-dioxygenase-like lactoylglutathione lyase family enzyme
MKNLGTFTEVQLPADDIEAMLSFYGQLGYKLTSQQPWGAAQLTDSSGATLTFFLRKFWPEAALAFKSADLKALKSELAEQSIQIEEDSVDLEPPRLSFRDPSGNLIYVYQG